MKMTLGIAVLATTISCRTVDQESGLKQLAEEGNANFQLIYCRQNLELRRILKVVPDLEDGRYSLQAITDDYGSGDSAWPTLIARRRVQYDAAQEKLSAYNVEFQLFFSRGTDLPPTKIDGDPSLYFHGELSSGMRRSFRGKYTCAKNRSIGLTIQGDEPDGGFSIVHGAHVDE